jgi:hypothetical protein
MGKKPIPKKEYSQYQKKNRKKYVMSKETPKTAKNK